MRPDQTTFLIEYQRWYKKMQLPPPVNFRIASRLRILRNWPWRRSLMARIPDRRCLWLQ